MRILCDLTGRTILLTGATGYLGQQMMFSILEAGAEVIVTARNEEKLDLLKSQLNTEQKKKTHVILANLDSTDGLNDLCLQINNQFSSIHGVVNNAYGGRVGDLASITSEDFFLACQFNLIVPFSLVKLLLPLLNKGADEYSGGSSVVNIASMYGVVSPDPGVYGETGLNNPIHYGATKAGLIQVTRYMACHLGDKNIRVNSVSPGPFPNVKKQHGIDNFYQKLSDKVPMKRVGRPEEVAAPVVFLLSDAASYINGANVPVDGGWTAW